jgi:class 3 adenylate cyclase/tetratricopeptide (TPR) repeat protein
LQCAACGTENREGRRFCSQCGAALANACPACGFLNDPGENFCGGCGARVGPPPPAEAPKPAAPQPPARPSKIDRPAEETEATRRQVTVMFCDLAGSTALSEKLDPEELSELLAAYQDTCAEVIHHLEGHIGRYVGDALLVYFGYPRAHEDDARRAVQAGLRIVEAIHGLSAKLDQPGVELAVRIGIATGLVVIGDIGTGERRERAAIVGETPNLAARLQALAQPGTVVIGSSTERLIEGLFVCEDLGPQTLKGISQPITAYVVRGETGAHTRFEAKARHGLTPLVGRREEINLLVARWQQAKQGEGQVVLLSGEAGVGKSRILQAFQGGVEKELRNRVLYFCSPYHRDTPFYPLIDQTQRALRFEKNDSAEQKLDKLDAAFTYLGLPVKAVAPLFALLLGLPTDKRYGTLSLSPEDVKKKTLDAIFAVVDAMARQNPVLMVIEDLHWVDPSMLEFLNLLVERLATERILLVGTSRPDFELPWGDRPHVSLVALKRLTRRESAAIIDEVTGGKALPEEVLEQIITRTDGVPLFVEELTKTALESGVLTDSGDRYTLSGPLPPFAIPASLRDSLMARLDRLAPVKEVAQVAAALGRTFSREVLASISKLAESGLEEALSHLVEAELIYRRGLPPDVVYEFKHALVQDVAYGSLLRNKRQQLHREIAELLQTQFPDTGKLHPEMLARHYREAGLLEQAIPHTLRAGEIAAMRFARTEAAAHYQTALELARSLPPSDAASRSRVQAVLKLASVASNREQFERQLKNLEDARTLATQLRDDHLLSQVLYWIGRAHYVLGQFDLAVEFAEQSLRIADTLQSDPLQLEDRITADPLSLLARIHCLRGEPKQATTYGARAVEEMHRLRDRIEEASAAGVLAFAHSVHGRFPQAAEAAERGIKVARGTEHLPTLAACFMFRAIVEGWRGNLGPAVSDFEEAIAASEGAGDVFRKYLCHGFCGQAYLVADDPAAAEAELTQCLELGAQIGTSFHRGAFQALLARVRLAQGDVGGALRESEEALKVSAEAGQEWSRSIALRNRGHALLATRPPALDEAEQVAREAIAIQEQRECRWDLAWSQLLLGRVAAAKGNWEEARRSLAAADALFGEMGVARGRQLTRAALATLPGGAATNRAQAS